MHHCCEDRSPSDTWREAQRVQRLAAQLDRHHVTSGHRLEYDEATDRGADGDVPTRRLERDRNARLLNS